MNNSFLDVYFAREEVTFMKYENGKDVFPERLLKQIQKYAAGKLVYIPSPEKKIGEKGPMSFS